jgi:hypothetical protein
MHKGPQWGGEATKTRAPEHRNHNPRAQIGETQSTRRESHHMN